MAKQPTDHNSRESLGNQENLGHQGHLSSPAKNHLPIMLVAANALTALKAVAVAATGADVAAKTAVADVAAAVVVAAADAAAIKPC
jgi:hypothetical protein